MLPIRATHTDWLERTLSSPTATPSLSQARDGKILTEPPKTIISLTTAKSIIPESGLSSRFLRIGAEVRRWIPPKTPGFPPGYVAGSYFQNLFCRAKRCLRTANSEMNNAIYLMPFGSQLSAAEYAARAKTVLMEMEIISEPDENGIFYN